MAKKYDFLVVGAGLFGSVFAQRAAEYGRRVLVIERRNHLAGIAHCDTMEGIPVQRYGPHIFYTDDREVWNYVNRFACFNHYTHAPLAACADGMYNLPFNMNTFSRLWGVRTPAEAQAELRRQTEKEHVIEAHNLEERCLQLFGRDIYEWLLKDYLEKQWGRPCAKLPPDASILWPPRFTYDNRYFAETYQGIPLEGYDVMIKRMLAACDVKLKTDYMGFGVGNPDIAERTIFTGMIDEYFRFKRGTLDYRTLRYETEVLNQPDYQGTAVVNHIPANVPYTRTIEHKHFVFGKQPKTVVTKEYPVRWSPTMEPYFPVHDDKNLHLYNAYRALSVTQLDVVFCGRLGTYQYYTMDQTVRAALDLAEKELNR